MWRQPSPPLTRPTDGLPEGVGAGENHFICVFARGGLNDRGCRDIPSGTYHTSGGSQCYYATLGSTDTSNIMDNNNFNGPETVDVSGAYAFQITGGCTWHKIG